MSGITEQSCLNVLSNCILKSYQDLIIVLELNVHLESTFQIVNINY